MDSSDSLKLKPLVRIADSEHRKSLISLVWKVFSYLGKA